ncbi:MAG TPA: 16S rRNA methyltransferase, partial [Pyrodictium sp.]|nr:16S rRNA methyltransferase [Pyrodictium sp.]
MSQNYFSYDEAVIRELHRVYSCCIETVLQSLTQPPYRYYVRVNVLRADPSWLAEQLRKIGFEVYVDEFIEEALWFPV